MALLEPMKKNGRLFRRNRRAQKPLDSKRQQVNDVLSSLQDDETSQAEGEVHGQECLLPRAR